METPSLGPGSHRRKPPLPPPPPAQTRCSVGADLDSGVDQVEEYTVLPESVLPLSLTQAQVPPGWLLGEASCRRGVPGAESPASI